MRIRFAGDAFAFAENDVKDAGEEIVDDLFRGGLVFVAGNGELMALAFEGSKERRYAFVRMRVVAVMVIVIRYEHRTNTLTRSRICVIPPVCPKCPGIHL